MKLTNRGEVTPPIEIDYEDLQKCIFRLNALNHPTRRRILLAIEKLDEKATSDNITTSISLNQKIVVKHLTILVQAKMVDTQKNFNQQLIYFINEDTIAKASRFIEEINR